RHVTGAGGALRAVAPKLIQPVVEIDAVAAETAFGEDSRNLCSLLADAKAIRIHDHARQPRRQRQRAQLLAFGSDAAIGIERTELVQQALRLFQGRRGWRIEE